MSKQDLMDNFMWDVKERIAKLEAENAKLRKVVEAAQEVLNAELKVESYMNHMNKYVGLEIDELGRALAVLDEVVG